MSPSPIVAKINVTPIIDVALVLVIILLITAPMIAAADLELTLPRARTQGLGDATRVNVTLGRDGQVAIDENVVAPAAFVALLARRLVEKKYEHPVVVIRADSGADHRDVRALIRETRHAGAERLAIATDSQEDVGP